MSYVRVHPDTLTDDLYIALASSRRLDSTGLWQEDYTYVRVHTQPFREATFPGKWLLTNATRNNRGEVYAWVSYEVIRALNLVFDESNKWAALALLRPKTDDELRAERCNRSRAWRVRYAIGGALRAFRQRTTAQLAGSIAT